MRFREAASEVWPGVPPINPALAQSLVNVALWAEKGGRGMPDITGLQGLFLEPSVRPAAPQTMEPLAVASVSAVMGKLGSKGGASKSQRKIAAAHATLAKINAARAAKKAAGSEPSQ